MKKYIVITLLLFPYVVSAYGPSDVFCGTGFGASAANGTYSYYGVNVWSTDVWSTPDGAYLVPNSPSHAIIDLTSPNVDSSNQYWSATGDLVNTDWSYYSGGTAVAPFGVTTLGACAAPAPPVTATTSEFATSLGIISTDLGSRLAVAIILVASSIGLSIGWLKRTILP